MNATLPRSLVIDNIVHVQEWKTKRHIVYQNYSSPRATSNQPLQDLTPEILGSCLFHVYEIQHNPAEELGPKLGSYTSLDAAMNFVAQQEQLA